MTTTQGTLFGEPPPLQRGRCQSCGGAVVVERDDLITELAHRRTHVTCEMERDRLKAERDAWKEAYEGTDHGQMYEEWQAERQLTAEAAEKLRAERDRLRAELTDCATCGGTGVMQVVTEVLAPFGEEIPGDELCAECGGNGKSLYARLKAENERLLGLITARDVRIVDLLVEGEQLKAKNGWLAEEHNALLVNFVEIQSARAEEQAQHDAEVEAAVRWAHHEALLWRHPIETVNDLVARYRREREKGGSE